MKKRFISTSAIIYLMLLLIVSSSCNQLSSNKNEGDTDVYKRKIAQQHVLSGEEWLKSIFHCETGNDFCFPDEEKVTTERYYEFFIETIGLYEYPTFETEEERVAAENAYKNKWKDIYPLDNEMLYPFGREMERVWRSFEKCLLLLLSQR